MGDTGDKLRGTRERGNAPGGEDGQVRWERDLVRRLASESLAEQRRARRWGIFFKLLGFAYVTLLLLLLLPDKLPQGSLKDGHTAVVEIEGIIGPDQKASADSVIEGLRDAFEDEKTKGVIVRINSPGGSPVQAGYINDEIRRLKAKYEDISVYAVVTDLCASGGYYVAAAADQIYVDRASLVGSIGVLLNGFGFTGTMEKLGVERRLLTAGEHKALFDPFSPLEKGEVEHLKTILDELHEQFIARVREGRGDRLAGGEELFSGLIWSGERSVELGLADGFGSASYVAREIIGAEKLVDFTRKEDLMERLAERLGAGMGTALARLLGPESPPAVSF
ncbi:MAG: S49 family peptidase [Chromatiales bacterium]